MDFTTVVVVFLTGFFLPAANVAFNFFGPRPARPVASIERSEAFRLRVPSMMSAGFSPGLVALGGMGVVGTVGVENAAYCTLFSGLCFNFSKSISICLHAV